MDPRKLLSRLLAGHLRNVAYDDFRRLVKPYQIRQFLALVERYDLDLRDRR